jgi:phosphatidylglycerol:prolipoprotein diacylglycerol transferase
VIRCFLPVPDPIAFRLFGLEIRWYAIMLVLGIIAGVTVMYIRAPKYGVEPRDRVLDFILNLLWAIIWLGRWTIRLLKRIGK